MPTPTYVPLATLTLGSSASSVSFTSIPSTYRDLRLHITGNTTSLANTLFVLNADAGGSSYIRVCMAARSGNNSPFSATATSGSGHLNWQTATTSSSRAFGIVDFMDYSATDKHKHYLSRAGTQVGDATYSGTEVIAGRYASTSAITQIQVVCGSGSFTAGSTLDLYGIAS